MTRIHASCVAIGGKGILIRGASGSGKSSLALKLINSDSGELVGDDQLDIGRENGDVIAKPVEALASLMEVRGVGVLPTTHLSQAPVKLVVDLVQPDDFERMPEPRNCSVELEGVSVPRIQIISLNPDGGDIARFALKCVEAGSYPLIE